MRLAGQAPCRRRPLSSNVRPHTTQSMTIDASSHRSQDQVQSQAWQRPPERSLFAMKANAFAAATEASMKRSTRVARRKTNPIHSPAAHGAGRPSTGKRLTIGCPRVRNPTAPSRGTAAVWLNSAAPELARNTQASGQRSSALQVLQSGHGPRVRPNPSLERTRTGMAPWPRARAVYHRSHGQRTTPALSAQLKR